MLCRQDSASLHSALSQSEGEAGLGLAGARAQLSGLTCQVSAEPGRERSGGFTPSQPGALVVGGHWSVLCFQTAELLRQTETNGERHSGDANQGCIGITVRTCKNCICV